MKKEAEMNELENTSAGVELGPTLTTCPNCKKRFSPDDCETRTITEKCVANLEIKCPYCGQWFR